MKIDLGERDPIGEYLRDRLRQTKEPFPGQAARPRRRSLAKVTVLAVLSISPFIAGGIVAGVLSTWGGGGSPRADGEAAKSDRAGDPASAGGDAARGVDAPASDGDLAREEAGRIILVHGGVDVARGKVVSPAGAGDALLGGDAVITGEDAAAGISLTECGDTAPLLVLGRSGRIRLASGADLASPDVAIDHGTLAASVSQEAGRAAVSFEVKGARVDAASAVLAIQASEGGALERVSVADGEALVARAADERTFRVTRGWSLDGRTWSLAPGAPDERIMARLEALVALERAFEDGRTGTSVESAAGDGGADGAGAGHGSGKDGIVARIRQALADGDVELAIDLVENEGAGRKDAAFLVAAADAYREAEKWKDAADMYVSASGGTQGKEAERVLLRAADIKLRKLGDAAGAAAAIAEYLQRFPDGAYLDEALYLAAAVQAKIGDKVKARATYEEYLAKFPGGAQAVKAHVALAQILAGAGGGGGGGGGGGKDCKGAIAHLAAVAGKADGPAFEAEIAKVEAACGKGGAQ